MLWHSSDTTCRAPLSSCATRSSTTRFISSSRLGLKKTSSYRCPCRLFDGCLDFTAYSRFLTWSCCRLSGDDRSLSHHELRPPAGPLLNYPFMAVRAWAGRLGLKTISCNWCVFNRWRCVGPTLCAVSLLPLRLFSSTDRGCLNPTRHASLLTRSGYFGAAGKLCLRTLSSCTGVSLQWIMDVLTLHIRRYGRRSALWPVCADSASRQTGDHIAFQTEGHGGGAAHGSNQQISPGQRIQQGASQQRGDGYGSWNSGKRGRNRFEPSWNNRNDNDNDNDGRLGLTAVADQLDYNTTE